jgi:hypothetical protein
MKDAAPVTNTTVKTVRPRQFYKQLIMVYTMYILERRQHARLLLTLNIVSLLPRSIQTPFPISSFIGFA